MTTLEGRNRFTTKALVSVVSAITAEGLGVKASEVRVDLADDNGLLGVTASAPVSIRSIASDGAAVGGTTILDRLESAREGIRHRMLELTGSTVGTVNLRLTSAHIDKPGRRVR